MTDPAVAPYGSWRSPIRIDDLVGDNVRLGRALARRRRRLLARGPPGRGRPAGRSSARPRTARSSDLTAAPVRVRTRVHEYGGGAVRRRRRRRRRTRTSPTGGSTGSIPGPTAPVPITPAGPWRYADLRFDAARRRFLAVREDHGRRRRGRQRDRGRAARRRARPARPRHRAGLRRRAAALARTASQLAWLEWDHPDMPWDATRLRVAPVAPDGSLGEPELAAGGPDESIVQPEWAPDGDAPLRLGPQRLVEPVPARRRPAPRAAGADGGGVRRPELGVRPLVVRVPAGRLDRRGRPRGGRDRLYPHRAGRASSARSRAPFTEFEGLQVGPGGIVALAGAPGSATVVVRLDPETLAPAGVLRRSSSLALDADAISFPEPIEFPTSGGRDGARALLPAAQPGVRRARRTSGRRSSCSSHGGPTSNASTGLNLVIQFLTSRGHRGGRRGLRRAAPATAATYRRAARRRVGRRRRRRLRRGRGRCLVERGDVDPATGWRSPAAAPAATRRSRPSRSATRSRAGISAFGVGDLEIARPRDAQVRVALPGPAGRAVPGAWPSATASARRSTASTGSRARCSSSRAPRTGSSRRPRPRRSSRRSRRTASRTPTSRSRARATASAARPPSAGRSRRELSFLGQVFGFEPADAIEPVDARRPRRLAGATRAPGRDAAARRRTRPPPTGAGHDATPMTAIELVLAPAGRRDRRWRTSPGGIGIAVPDPARPRRPGPRARPHRSRRPGHRAAARGRLPAVPAADPVRRRLLHADPRLQGEPPGHRPARDRARAVHDASSSRLVASALVPELGWAPAFALGAIVAPPDAVAATSIFRRLGVPRRVVTILEGESLVNDASALILFRVARRGGPGRLVLRSWTRASRSSSSGVGGIAVGVVIGTGSSPPPGGGPATRRSRSSLSLLAPIAAYLPAETLGRQRRAGDGHGRASSPAGRRPAPSPRTAGSMGRGVWAVVLFLINGFVFMLIGLQLPAILGATCRPRAPPS